MAIRRFPAANNHGYYAPGVGLNTFSGAVSISCWVKFYILTGDAAFFCKWGATGTEWLLGKSNSTGTIFGGFNGAVFVNTVVAVTNRWYLVGATWEPGTSTRMFINGAFSASGAGPTHTATAQKVCLSVNENGTSIDSLITAHCCIWNVALADQEMIRLYGATDPRKIRPGAVRGYWPGAGGFLNPGQNLIDAGNGAYAIGRVAEDTENAPNMAGVYDYPNPLRLTAIPPIYGASWRTPVTGG